MTATLFFRSNLLRGIECSSQWIPEHT